MSDRAIPLAEPCLDGNERRYIDECLATNWVSSVGPFVERFEQEFAAFVGAGYAVACASGTAALHVAFRVLGVGAGDEVFVPTLTFIASANAAAYLGAQVTFIDAERETWNLDPSLIVDELERRARNHLPMPKAVEVVHLLGHPADIVPIIEACDRFGVDVVEDAAEALGATYRGGTLDGRHVGTVGRIGCYSFNGNKVITTGGGGMLVTDDPNLAARARHLTTQARLPGLAYEHDDIGYNYRLSNVAAAIGVAQLEQLPEFLARKRSLASRYDEAFAALPGGRLPPNAPWADRSAWLYSLPARDEHTSNAMLGALTGAGISARPIWAPVHRMAPYMSSPVLGSGTTADEIAARTVSLPSSVGLKDQDQRFVIDLVQASLSERVV